MDVKQDDSIGNSNPIATNTNVTSSSPMASQTSPVADGIVFDSDNRSSDIIQADNNSVPAVSDEMKLDSQPGSTAPETHPGIENGSSRFSSAPDKTVPAVEKAPALPEAAPSEPKVAASEVREEDEPKGEILTSFVNTQNYSDIKKGLNESMPSETTRNETNSSLHDASPVAPHSIVTPDPTKTNEAESHINPASFAMPASAEIRSATPEEATQKSAEPAEHSSPDSSTAIKNHVPLSEHYDHIASSSESVPVTIVPEKKKASLKWLWITLGSIFGVAFVFAGLVTATETGVINWGLDKYYSKMGVQKV